MNAHWRRFQVSMTNATEGAVNLNVSTTRSFSFSVSPFHTWREKNYWNVSGFPASPCTLYVDRGDFKDFSAIFIRLVALVVLELLNFFGNLLNILCILRMSPAEKTTTATTYEILTEPTMKMWKRCLLFERCTKLFHDYKEEIFLTWMHTWIRIIYIFTTIRSP